MNEIVLVSQIENLIYLFRGQKVVLDRDLALMYGVETKRLNEQVKRNLDRFPEDFMFQLTKEEFSNLKSQIATSNWGGRRNQPYAFTEQGVAMLSTVLNSKQAVQVNIQIMRTFVRMRQMVLANKDLARRLDGLEQKYDKQFKVVFESYPAADTTGEETKTEDWFLIGYKNCINKRNPIKTGLMIYI